MPDGKCEAFDCDLPGRYTDSSLEGRMYCLYHRTCRMKFNQEQKIKKAEAERDSWRRTAEKLEGEKRDLAIEIKAMAEKLKQIQNMSRPG